MQKKINSLGISLITVIFIVSFETFVFGFPVPDSGQTDSYATIWGEDSDYVINPPQYTKLDSQANPLELTSTSWSMVKDNVTGLIWEVKTDDGSIHDKNKLYTWYDPNSTYPGINAAVTDTQDFIYDLNSNKFGSFSDWRIPSLQELASIVLINKSSPVAISMTFFPNVMPDAYWTSTTNVGNTSKAWVIQFNGANDDSLSKSSYCYVRAVRGISYPSIYGLVSNGNGTVTDTRTGLMWQVDDAGLTMNWEIASDKCENLLLAGYNDWRLPTREELRSLVNYSKQIPSIDTEYFPNTASTNYWTSTADEFNIGNFWCVSFYQGYVNYKPAVNKYYVRAVRGSQVILSGHTIINSPTQASSWNVGTIMPIRWETMNIAGNVKINISRAAGLPDSFETIVESTENSGAYSWTVTSPISTNAMLQIIPISQVNLGSDVGLFMILPAEIPNLSITPAYREVSSFVGSTTVAIINSGGGTMIWQAISDSTWITFPNGNVGVNSDSLQIQYSSNHSFSSRTATITVSASATQNSPKTFEIRQAMANPQLSVSPLLQSVQAVAASTSFTVVNTGTGLMPWIASSQATWLTISSGSSGTDQGIITISYDSNYTSARIATIQIIASNAVNISQTVQVAQAAGEPVLTVTPSYRNIPANIGANNTTTFTVTNSGTGSMAWSAQSNASWLTIESGFSGTNIGTIVLRYAANIGQSRTGTVTITAPGITGSPSIITIVQDAGHPVLTVTPLTVELTSSSGTFSVTVTNTGTGPMNWSVQSGASWITIVTDNTGVDAGLIFLQYAENTGEDRSGTLTFTASDAENSPQSIKVIQAKKVDHEPPKWSVDPRNYQYQIMITAVIYDQVKGLLGKDGDLLAAYVGNECRGVAKATKTDLGIRFFLQVWSNTVSGDIVTFKYFDSENGAIYDQIVESIVFHSNMSFGNINEAYQIVTASVNLNIPVKKGWNWISINVAADDMSVSKVFASVFGKGQYLVGQSGFCEYYSGKWFGTLDTINPTKMYMLKMAEADTVIFTGDPLFMDSMPITVNKGWNWISYLPYSKMTLNQALQSIGKSGQIIVGQSGYAEYYGTWWGSLTELTTNSGYQLKMLEDKTLIYPTVSKRMISPKNEDQFEDQLLFDSQNYQYQGTITAVIESEHYFLNNPDNDKIIAFVKNECRGIGPCVKTNDGIRFFVQVWSNTEQNETIGFKYFDYETKRMENIFETMVFSSQMTKGSIQSPVILRMLPVNLDEIIKMLQILSGQPNQK